MAKLPVIDESTVAIVGEVLPAPGRELIAFQGMKYQLIGAEIKHNLAEYIAKATELHNAFIIEPEDDDEISYRHLQSKAIKEAETRLIEIDVEVTASFESLDEFKKGISELKRILKDTRLIAEDQVKNFKKRKVAEIINDHTTQYLEIVSKARAKVPRLILPIETPDFKKAIHGLKTFKSMEQACKAELSRVTQQAERLVTDYSTKLDLIDGIAKGYEFLIPDLQQLIPLSTECILKDVTERIEAHKISEANKLEEERIRIRAEEQEKADKKKLADLQQAEDERLAAQSQSDREERATQADKDLKEAEELRKAAQHVNECALRAETGSEMRKEQRQANKMLVRAKKLEAEAPKKALTPLPKLAMIVSILKRVAFLTEDEAEQAISEAADELEKKRHDLSKGEM
jgi:hypothetical protein